MKLAIGLAALAIAALPVARATELQDAAPPPTREVILLLQEGYRLVAGNNPAGAVAKFREVLAIDVGNRGAKYGISTAFIKMERFKESVAILDALIAQFPEDYVLKNNAAWLYATAEPRFRNPEKAVNLAREALLMSPRDQHVWSTLAEAHYSAGEYEKALRSALQAEALAKAHGSETEEMQTYVKQRMKCEEAAAAFRLLE